MTGGVYVYFLNDKKINKTNEILISLILEDLVKNGVCRYTNKQISNIFNLHPHSVSRTISILVDDKWIQTGYNEENNYRYIILGERGYSEFFNIDNPNFITNEALNYKPKGCKVKPRKRFRVLSRDKHTCQYCGNKAPDVRLEIDHIKPISKGGDNSYSNLITSCKNCNIGKSNFEYNIKAIR